MWRQGRSLEQQVQMLESFFNMAPDILCIVNFEGAFTKVNPSFIQALGYSEDELYATSFLSFVHPFDLPDVEAKLATMILERKPQHFEARFVCKDGAIRILAWSTMTDHDSRHISCAARDVTQARRAERDLRQTMMAIDSTAIVAVTNLTGQLTDVNENHCKISGFTRDELLGRDMGQNADLHSQEHREHLRSTLAAGNAWSGEIRNRTKSGGIFVTHAVITPIVGLDGQTERYLSISFDLTEEIKMKEALAVERSKSVQSAKMATLGELASGIAHEINTPLSVIMLTATMLPALTNQADQIAEKTEVIEKACDRVAKIVNGLRKYSRIADQTSAGHFSVSYLVAEALALTDSKARRHEVDITVTVETEAKIQCNEIEIEQVIVNLVNNAIDAIKETDKTKWIKISIFESIDHVGLRVRDSGLGIPEDVSVKLFQPFFTTKPVGEGTGLGLSIVKNILNSHNACIELMTEDPHTCFEIRFLKNQGDSRGA